MKIIGDASVIEINILNRSNSGTDDYWDANWLECEIKIKVPGFSAQYNTNLRVDELLSFCKNLVSIQNWTETNAIFTTLEEGLYLHCHIEANGGINIEGKAENEIGNNLTFRFQTDFSSLNIFTNELILDLKHYPLIGNIE